MRAEVGAGAGAGKRTWKRAGWEHSGSGVDEGWELGGSGARDKLALVCLTQQ